MLTRRRAIELLVVAAALLAVLVMHGGLDAGATTTHLPAVATRVDQVPHLHPTAAEATGAHAHHDGTELHAAHDPSGSSNHHAVALVSAAGDAGHGVHPPADEPARHDHNALLLTCVGILVAAAALGVALTISRAGPRGIVAVARVRDRIRDGGIALALPPPRLLLCVERC